MADWVKCTPFGRTERSIYINVERIVAVAEGENGSTVIYGGQNGTDRGEIAVTEPPESILGGSRNSAFLGAKRVSNVNAAPRPDMAARLRCCAEAPR